MTDSLHGTRLIAWGCSGVKFIETDHQEYNIMCRPPTSKQLGKKASIVWSSLVEHIIKLTLYSAFLIHAIQSTQRSTTNFSYAVNICISLVSLTLIKSELTVLIQRIQRKLPPGYLGFPIIRDIKFILSTTNGGVQQSLDYARRNYGTMFSQTFFGQTNIAMGGQDDLLWLFNNDRKAFTEIAWPPNIVMLLGPGAVANQTGKYHRVLRRLLEPYFANKFVTNYLKCMDDTTLQNWMIGQVVESINQVKYLKCMLCDCFMLVHLDGPMRMLLQHCMMISKPGLVDSWLLQ